MSCKLTRPPCDAHSGDSPLDSPPPSPRVDSGPKQRPSLGLKVAGQPSVKYGDAGQPRTDPGEFASIGLVNERQEVPPLRPKLQRNGSNSSVGTAEESLVSSQKSLASEDGEAKGTNSGHEDGESEQRTEDEVGPMLSKNNPNLKSARLVSKAVPSWARPVLRRSCSGGSKMSGGSKLSGETKRTETTEGSAIPAGVQLGELREAKSVSVIWDRPADGTYSFIEKVGSGGFGEVWLCVHKSTALEYAVKRLAAREQKDLERLLVELKAFERFSCPYLVTLHEVFVDPEHLYLVMDLCNGGDLSKFLFTFQDEPERLLRKMDYPDQVKGLPTSLIGHFLWQMLVGIAYLHHHRFVHRDVKLQNYVLRDAAVKLPVLQLVDFGMTVRFRKGIMINGTVGTVKYMAPEVLHNSYTEKCDIWSIGILCYILCTERSPWGSAKTTRDVCRCITENMRESWPLTDKPQVVKNLVEAMLRWDYNTRPSAKEILKESQWLKQYSKQGGGNAPKSCCPIS